ncbi:hypothetical protein ACGC1H_003350 [Rhizoctonia solani]|uniref:Uncharacterized protein n=1 Tax=Rhizoctonia solani TaxID=456999 RepID=A0A8H3B4J0_9AGAM|nr:unnamed protein product [Rhizoctonia solani]
MSNAFQRQRQARSKEYIKPYTPPRILRSPVWFTGLPICFRFTLHSTLLLFSSTFVTLWLVLSLRLNATKTQLQVPLIHLVDMFGAPLVRATLMQQQRRPTGSNLPSSTAIRTTMANLASQSQRETHQSNGPQAQTSAAKPASKYVDVDPLMFIDSPFVGGATLCPATSHESSHSRGNGKNGSFDLKFFNPSSDPRLLAM